MRLPKITTSFTFVVLSSLIFAGCQILPSTAPKTEMPTSQTATDAGLQATILLEQSPTASFSGVLRYSSQSSEPLSALALRLEFPKQAISDETVPFVIPDSVKTAYWQTVINQLDCSSSETICTADLALITLNPTGSELSNLPFFAAISPEVFAPGKLTTELMLNAEYSLATTKTADPIKLDFSNQLLAE